MRKIIFASLRIAAAVALVTRNLAKEEYENIAMFDVVKDDTQPFIVRSNTISVTALGTEFNVSAYSEYENVNATLL